MNCKMCLFSQSICTYLTLFIIIDGISSTPGAAGNKVYTVRKIITTDKSPSYSLPISQAVQVDNMLYISGNIGMTVNGTLVDGLENQTRLALDNIGFILEEANSSFQNVIKVTVLLSDLNNFATVNVIYSEYFIDKYPARTAFQVARLPWDALIEIEVVAIVGHIIDVKG